jgi:hypothetical protein
VIQALRHVQDPFFGTPIRSIAALNSGVRLVGAHLCSGYDVIEADVEARLGEIEQVVVDVRYHDQLEARAERFQ